MSNYEIVQGLGDTITCDQCDEVSDNWYTDGSHAICTGCAESYLLSTEGEE